MSKNNDIKFIELPSPTDSIAFFETIKELSNNYWAETIIDDAVYGFQIQQNSKWRNGLTESELNDFQNELGFTFPSGLRNFYLTMNGLDKKGINVFANSGHEFAHRPVYYSFPEDLEIIKETIDWIYDATDVNRDTLPEDGISRIFPVCEHKFLLIDDPSHCILSMFDRDIIPWADKISKLLATHIFENISNASDFESNLTGLDIKFWLDDY